MCQRDVLHSSVFCIFVGKLVQVSYTCAHSATKSHLQHRQPEVLKNLYNFQLLEVLLSNFSM